MSSPPLSGPSTSSAAHGHGKTAINRPLKTLGRAEACHQCRKRKVKCDAGRPACSSCRRTHNKMVRVNPHFGHLEPNCTYDSPSPYEAEDTLTSESLRRLEARVEELEGMVSSDSRKYTAQSPATTSSGSSKSPLSSESPLEPQPITVDYLPDADELSPSFSTGYELPVTSGDEWPTTLPPKQLVLHLIDLFFSCWPNSRRILHRPTFLLSLLEPPSSSRFPYVGLLHAICAAGAIYSPFVAVLPQPILSNRPTEDIFPRKTHFLDGRMLAFDEEQFLLAKHMNTESANRGEHLLEVVQASLINTWWAFSYGRYIDVWTQGDLASRLCIALGLNFSDTIRQPLPDRIREQLLIGPPRSHMEVELRRNVFWLVYAFQRYHLAVLPFLPFDVSDEDIHQTLPGTLEAFESGIDDGQERQSLMSPDLFTTHRDNLDDFGLYIKCATMFSRIHVLQARQFREPLTDEDIRESKEMKIIEAIISSMKSSALRSRFNPMEQPSSDALSNLYMSHISPHLATIACHMMLADWGDPSCESANKTLAAARAILRCTTGLKSTSWDCSRVDKIAAQYWCITAKIMVLALKKAPESLAPVFRTEIRLLRSMFLVGSNRILLFMRQRHSLDMDIIEQLGEKEAAMVFRDESF